MEEYLGVIKLFAGNYAPEGFALCNGQKLPIKHFEALYSILGTTYGGDGINDFALPNLSFKEREYFVRNTEVKRSHETGDPGNFGYLCDPVVESREIQKNYSEEPIYIICINGLYPSRA